MHSSSARRIRRTRVIQASRTALTLTVCAVLGACAGMQPKSAPRLATPPIAAPVAPDHDLLQKLLAAQFALQENDLAGAANGFAHAAALSTDPAVSEEATHLALAVRDWSLAQRALARWQVLAPGDPGVLQSRAWIALGEKRSPDAYADLAELGARSDDHGWRLIAQTLLGAPDKAVAAGLLERLATPARLGAKESNWVAVSQLAFKLGDKGLSQRLADATLARFHGSDGYIWSARLAIDRGDKIAARAMYAQALQRDPKNLQLRVGQAALLAASGDNAGAAHALATGPQDDATYAARAAYGARANDQPALKALYRELVADKSPRNGDRLYLLGQVAEMIDRSDEALGWYRDLSDDSNHWFDAQTREAVVLDKLGRTSDAINLLHELEAQAADDSETLGNTYLLEADIVAHKGHPADALAVYTRAMRALPDDARLFYARALFNIDQGDLAAGERDLRSVVKQHPDNAEALNALGYTLADHSKRGDPVQQEALKLIQRALKLKPDEPAIIDSLGWTHYRMGDLGAALKALREAYAKQPDADIAAHLGEVLWVSGQRTAAQRIWDQGRAKDAKNKTLLEAIKRLTT